MGRRKAVDMIYLNTSEAFDTIFHDILMSKLRKHRLNEVTVE